MDIKTDEDGEEVGFYVMQSTDAPFCQSLESSPNGKHTPFSHGSVCEQALSGKKVKAE